MAGKSTLDWRLGAAIVLCLFVLGATIASDDSTQCTGPNATVSFYNASPFKCTVRFLGTMTTLNPNSSTGTQVIQTGKHHWVAYFLNDVSPGDILIRSGSFTVKSGETIGVTLNL